MSIQSIYDVVKYILFFPLALLVTIRIVLARLFQNNTPLPPVDLNIEPKCLKNPTLGKHGSIHLKKRNIEIHYVAKGDPSKPLMLFVHGFPEFWYSWRHQLTEFGDDYFAVAMDLTGYGNSSKPTEFDRYRTSEIAEDVKEFILELGYDSCILVGHDWGGIISFEVTFKYPELIKHLIIANAPSIIGYFKGLSIKQTLRSSYICFFQIPYFSEYYLSMNQCSVLKAIFKPAGLTDEELMSYRYMFCKGGFTWPLNYYRNIFHQPIIPEEPKLSSVSTLIIWGDKDHALGKRLAATSAQSFEKCVIKYIKGASHWVNQECHVELNKHIRDYLDGASS